MAGTYITRAQSSGNRRTMTFAAWVKRTGNHGQYNHLFTVTPNPGSWDSIRFTNNDRLAVEINNEGSRLITNRLFRDAIAWYHIVIAIDTTQATSSDRIKLWVNGVQETSFNTSGYPSQNQDLNFNLSGQNVRIGHNVWSEGGAEYFVGSLAHVHFIDGTAYDADTFGEFDSTTGIWKPKTEPSVTYGTNGYFLKFDSSGAMGTDSSGNGNNFTITSGSLNQTQDTPTNNFPTFCNGHIIPNNSTNSFTKGGLSTANSDAIWQSEVVPFPFSKGKYYWEYKIHHNGGDPRLGAGVMNASNANINRSGNNSAFFSATGSYGFHSGGSGDADIYANGTNISSSYSTISNFDSSDGQLVGFAIDCDNKRMYINVGGTWQNSADPSNGTNPYDISSGWTTGDLMYPFFTSHNSNIDFNFGNGYFGTSAVASAGTNASGNGIFEFDVPTGFTALCSKGINDQEYS